MKDGRLFENSCKRVEVERTDWPALRIGNEKWTVIRRSYNDKQEERKHRQCNRVDIHYFCATLLVAGHRTTHCRDCWRQESGRSWICNNRSLSTRNLFRNHPFSSSLKLNGDSLVGCDSWSRRIHPFNRPYWAPIDRRHNRGSYWVQVRHDLETR